MELVTKIFAEHTFPDANNPYVLQAAFSCHNCRFLSIGFSQSSLHPERDRADNTDDFFIGARWLPLKGAGRDFEDVPEHIASAASEAYECRSISALRAAAQLVRSVIEASAKEVGVTSSGIYAKIEQMYQLRLIREHVKDAAHEIRLLGNEMAHGDFVNPITEEEVDLALILMGEVLEELFQSPARVKRAREARLARNNQTP